MSHDMITVTVTSHVVAKNIGGSEEMMLYHMFKHMLTLRQTYGHLG